MRLPGVTVTEGTVASEGGSGPIISGPITVLVGGPSNGGSTTPITCDAVTTPAGYSPGQRVGLIGDATGSFFIVLGPIQ